MVKYDTIKILAIMTLLFGIMLVPAASAQNMNPPMQMPSLELEVTAIEFSNTDAIEGQDVTITVTIENLNSTMAVDNITLSLYLDYEIVQNFTGISLGSAESATYEYVWDSTSGIHNVTAMLVDGEMPLPDTQVSEELVVGLGDLSTILIALLVLALAVLVIAALPSVFAMVRK